MKNYLDQQKELEIAKARLQTLEEKKKIYFNKTQPKSKSFDKVMVQSSKVNNNQFLEYTSAIELLDSNLDILNNEICIMENYLKNMENSLRSMKGIMEKIFVAKYIDGLSVTQICEKTHYAQAQVYRYLRQIKKILKDDKK